MINGLDIFYTKLNKGLGLKIIENKSGSGLKLTSTAGKGFNTKLVKNKRVQVLKF